MAGTTRRTGQWIIAAMVALVLAAAIFVALHQPATPVDLAAVTRGPMAVTIDDEGETVVHDIFTVAAPLGGYLRRIELEPGDPVTRHQTALAHIVPGDPGFLDARSQAEAMAQEKISGADLAAARARIAQARAERALADRDLARLEALSRRGFSTRATLDAARARHDKAEAALIEAGSSATSAAYRLKSARAALISPTADASGRTGVAITAPVSGKVLRVRQKSEGPVSAGTPLVDIGDPAAMEIMVDLLSTDAVKIAEQAPVLIDKWGGTNPLHGKVRRIEPAGFTKFSALGVEEQRVNVFIVLTDPPALWRRLGHGYRVLVRIETWSRPNILRVPVAAIFRIGNDWNVFVVRHGRARRVPVGIGHLNDLFAEIQSGLQSGDQIILHPGDTITDGRRVTARD